MILNVTFVLKTNSLLGLLCLLWPFLQPVELEPVETAVAGS